MLSAEGIRVPPLPQTEEHLGHHVLRVGGLAGDGQSDGVYAWGEGRVEGGQRLRVAAGHRRIGLAEFLFSHRVPPPCRETESTFTYKTLETDCFYGGYLNYKPYFILRQENAC